VTTESGVLYVVATPIGNLGDMTLRAVEIMRRCGRIVAEDTRRSRQLLSHFGIPGKTVDRLDAHANERDLARVVGHLAQGEDVALLTDAGTPCVSDPGHGLVGAAIAAGVRVVPIPGASAVLAALVASGLAGEGRFRFLGFLPRSGSARRDALAVVADTPETVVLFEAPSRVQTTLRDLADATPLRRACVAREITKLHEQFVSGTCADLASDPREWLGEIALVLGAHVPDDRRTEVDDSALDHRIDEALARGDHVRTVAERVAAWSGRNKRDMYARVLDRRSRVNKASSNKAPGSFE
jgi:16S rRNA (cytidine1402-2'-O)-methyltransferase